MNDNVTDLFGVIEGGPDTNLDPQPKDYEFHFKTAIGEPSRVVMAYGFPAFNGMIYAVLDTPDDPLRINFCALASDVLYVCESEEFIEH